MRTNWLQRFTAGSDPEDDEDEIDDDPDLPDEWRDCSEDPEVCLNETWDAYGFPPF
jgi:hypothetical protein